jgi:two-component system, LuxR family, sensor kinase FixL
MKRLTVTPATCPENGKVSAWFRDALVILSFAVIFCIAQRLTFGLRFPPYERTTIWIPGALTFSVLLILQPGRWWTVYVGLCLGALGGYYGDDQITEIRALIAAQFHFASVALGVAGIRRFSSDILLGNISALILFSLTAGVLVPLATTLPIDLVRWYAGENEIWPVAIRSMLCISIGMLIGTPAIAITLAHGRTWWRREFWPQYVEFMLLTALLLVVGGFAFGQPVGQETPAALLYVPIPLMLWAAMRFGLSGVCWTLLVVAYQSTWNAIHGRGPFISDGSSDNVLQLQLFLLAMSLPLMFLAVRSYERSLAYNLLKDEIAAKERLESHFRLVVEAAPSAMMIVDQAGKVVLVNKQAENYFGYRRDEVIAEPVQRLLSHRHRATFEKLLLKAFAQPRPPTEAPCEELIARREDGTEFPVEIWLTLIQIKHAQLMLMAMVDITERKRAEEAKHELIHASRLAVLSEFTTSIAHELNQPLGAILNNADAADILLSHEAPPLEEVRQILADIRSEDIRASEIILRLRKLLRRGKLEFQLMDINQIVEESILLARAESRRRHVEIQAELATDLPLIQGDRVHLQQVLLNLMINGMEAMADSAGLNRLRLTTCRHGQFIQVGVSDSGPGIEREHLPRLFERFYSTKHEGMGMGLAISRSLMEEHGGSIWVDSQPGEGATFWISLPLNIEPCLAVDPEKHGVAAHV